MIKESESRDFRRVVLRFSERKRSESDSILPRCLVRMVRFF